MKKAFSLVLALALCLTLLPAAAMAEETSVNYLPYKNARLMYEYVDPRSYQTESVGLLAVRDEDGLWGIADKNGKLIGACEYSDVYDFYDGLARVKRDRKWGFIDKTGKEVLSCGEYDSVASFYEGMAQVTKDGKDGFINKNGQLIVPCEYDAAENFSEGVARVEKNGKWGLVDKSGSLVAACEYDAIDAFFDGMAVVVKDENVGAVNNSGKLVVPCGEYDYIERFSDGMASVGKNDKAGFIDKSGELVIPLVYDGAYDFHNGMAQVSKTGVWGVIDKTGKTIIPCGEYDSIMGFFGGMIQVMNYDEDWNWTYGFVDKSGKLVIPTIYADIDDFSEGLAKVAQRVSGSYNKFKYGYMDAAGKLVIPCEYDEGEKFTNGLAKVKRDGKQYIIDRTGNELFSVDYEMIYPFFSDFAVVRHGYPNMKDGVIDRFGKVILPPEYDDCALSTDGSFVLVEKDGKYGIVTLSAPVEPTPAPVEPTPTPSAPTAFSDVPAGEYFVEPVKWAVERKITTGTSATTFSPNNTCTTAQILTFLYRSQGESVVSVDNPFSDVAEGDYFYNAALWAYENGLVGGTTFGADVPCTRMSTVTYLWKLSGEPTPEGANKFTDVDDPAVTWAVENGVTTGTSETTFSPDATCTRGQIVTFLWRYEK